jgi:hypothetical protein
MSSGRAAPSRCAAPRPGRAGTWRRRGGRSCRCNHPRTSGFAQLLEAAVDVAGSIGVPIVLANTRPWSSHSSPAANRSLAWRTRCSSNAPGAYQVLVATRATSSAYPPDRPRSGRHRHSDGSTRHRRSAAQLGDALDASTPTPRPPGARGLVSGRRSRPRASNPRRPRPGQDDRLHHQVRHQGRRRLPFDRAATRNATTSTGSGSSLRVTPCSERCANWLLYGIQPKKRTASCGPATARAGCTRRPTLGIGGRRVLVSRDWSGKTLADHRADAHAWVKALLGISDQRRHTPRAADPSWRDRPGRVGTGPARRPGPTPLEHRLLRAISQRIQQRGQLAAARQRGGNDPPPEISATDRNGVPKEQRMSTKVLPFAPRPRAGVLRVNPSGTKRSGGLTQSRRCQSC